MLADWLNPVRDALAGRVTSIEIFFRDDDAGWADAQLYALLDCFNALQMPIDLAVIPQALSQPLADALLSRWQRAPALLGMHQHGYNHSNHAAQGRKCEFGNNRNFAQQYADLLAGQGRLQALLDDAVDSVFTPPWNRCTQITADCLSQLGFVGLSRNTTAEPVLADELIQIPIEIDWCGIRARAENPWTVLGRILCERLSAPQARPLGIMLHHAEMDSQDLQHLHELLALFSDQPQVNNRLMREFLIAA